MPTSAHDFPPAPRGLRGRSGELATLEKTIARAAPTRIALIGSGGSGKSMLACALGHRLARRFDGRIDWFRIGAWDFRTLVEMLALRFGTSRDRARALPELRAFLRDGGERLLVFDNHEDDRVTARLLNALDGVGATFVTTARRCLLGGVLVYPVVAPLVTAGRAAFPRVAPLTRLLRWNPLALDIADAIVASGEASLPELTGWLEARRVGEVRVTDHEDDVPEVAELVAWAWARLPAESRRMLVVLAHTQGDHVDTDSLATLARTPRAKAKRALSALLRFRLVQEPLARRFAVHAVVRYAIAKRSSFDAARFFHHYVAMLERDPSRIALEQTHLFAAMDHAFRVSDLDASLRVERLLARIDERR